MPKKKKPDLEDFKKKIIKNNNKLPIRFSEDVTDINSHSWFDIKKQQSLEHYNDIIFKKDKIKDEVISCKIYEIIFNETQKKIIHKWFDCFTDMYNEALTFIRTTYPFTKNEIIRSKIEEETRRQIKFEEFYNNRHIRDNLINIKKEIQIRSTLNIDDNKNKRIYDHTLDYAVQQLTSNIDSSRTNMLRGNIKRFRLKYWKYNRPSMSMDFEKTCFNKDNKFCFQQLGDVIYKYNNKEVILPHVECGVKVNYNRITNKYTLLFPIKIEPIIDENKSNNVIYLDPGLRTFMTGISENTNLTIGNNVNFIVSQKINKLLETKNNPKIKSRIKKKNEKTIYRKIKNKVDDLQWKTIKYLVKHFNGIFLGDMSAKNIVKKQNSVLSASQKRACLMTRYYVFQQRLKFKCEQNGVTFKIVDEYYTSKTCSNCGNLKENLGGNHNYNCNKCGININRDINGARNIYIKTLL